MRYEVAVAVESDSRESAMLQLKVAGFEVLRAVAKRAAASVVTPITEGVRASALTDMPADLSRSEHKAYVRGYGRACMAYARKHGGASISGGSADRAALTAAAVQHEWDRHPAAHKAGMTALHKEQTTAATYAALIAARKEAA